MRPWIVLILGLAGFAAVKAPEVTRTRTTLDHGAASVVFPRGKPTRVNQLDAASLSSVIVSIDKRLVEAGRGDEKDAINADIKAQFGAVTWFVDDAATGQMFTASGYALPAGRASDELTCARWLRKPAAASVLQRQCTELRLPEGQAIETHRSYRGGAVEVGRSYAIAGHRYWLGLSSRAPMMVRLFVTTRVRADDEQAFFDSFKVLGDTRSPQH